MFNAAGVNVALGCGMSAANGIHTGSLSSAVDGAYQYSNNSNDMLVQSTNNNWIEFDLGSALSNLATLTLYVDFLIWQNDDDAAWYPGDTITFMNGGRTVVGTHSLPTSWAGTTPPYIIDLVTIARVVFSVAEISSSFRALPYAALSGAPFATSLGATPTEVGCAWICINTLFCAGYTWSSSKMIASNPCSLFTNATSYRADDRSNSSVLLTAPTPTLFVNSTFRSLPNTDLVGTPFATFFGVTPIEYACAFYCSFTPPCTGYTWSSPTLFANNPCCACRRRMIKMMKCPRAPYLTPTSPDLYTNLTSYATNFISNSGVLWSAAPLGADAS